MFLVVLFAIVGVSLVGIAEYCLNKNNRRLKFFQKYLILIVLLFIVTIYSYNILTEKYPYRSIGFFDVFEAREIRSILFGIIISGLLINWNHSRRRIDQYTGLSKYLYIKKSDLYFSFFTGFSILALIVVEFPNIIRIAKFSISGTGVELSFLNQKEKETKIFNILDPSNLNNSEAIRFHNINLFDISRIDKDISYICSILTKVDQDCNEIEEYNLDKIKVYRADFEKSFYPFLKCYSHIHNNSKSVSFLNGIIGDLRFNFQSALADRSSNSSASVSATRNNLILSLSLIEDSVWDGIFSLPIDQLKMNDCRSSFINAKKYFNEIEKIGRSRLYGFKLHHEKSINFDICAEVELDRDFLELTRLCRAFDYGKNMPYGAMIESKFSQLSGDNIRAVYSYQNWIDYYKINNSQASGAKNIAVRDLYLYLAEYFRNTLAISNLTLPEEARIAANTYTKSIEDIIGTHKPDYLKAAYGELDECKSTDPSLRKLHMLHFLDLNAKLALESVALSRNEAGNPDDVRQLEKLSGKLEKFFDLKGCFEHAYESLEKGSGAATDYVGVLLKDTLVMFRQARIKVSVRSTPNAHDKQWIRAELLVMHSTIDEAYQLLRDLMRKSSGGKIERCSDIRVGKSSWADFEEYLAGGPPFKEPCDRLASVREELRDYLNQIEG